MPVTKSVNRNKATHFGHCQVCGAQQKLPNGVLAKHGYSLRWGFFSGVCSGADNLPFELSCSLVHDAVRFAEAQVGVITERIMALQSATGTKAWVHYYDNGRNGYKTGYRWIEVEIVVRHLAFATGYECDKTVYVGPDGKDHEAGFYLDKSVADTVTRLNEGYIKIVLQPRITELKQYSAWQQERVANWAPAELTPVK